MSQPINTKHKKHISLPVSKHEKISQSEFRLRFPTKRFLSRDDYYIGILGKVINTNFSFVEFVCLVLVKNLIQRLLRRRSCRYV